uniref:hypothetical protein n=1 Tax=Shigella sp. FC130 TaxID=1892896 RepID=UPI001A8DE8DF
STIWTQVKLVAPSRRLLRGTTNNAKCMCVSCHPGSFGKSSTIWTQVKLVAPSRRLLRGTTNNAKCMCVSCH